MDCSSPIDSSQNLDMTEPRDSEVIDLKREEDGMNRLQNPFSIGFRGSSMRCTLLNSPNDKDQSFDKTSILLTV